MNRNIRILILLLSLSSCNVRKEVVSKKGTTKERQRQEGRITIRDTIRFGMEMHRLSTGQTDKEGFVEILPVGPFTYSVADGFHGEAIRVLVQQRDRSEYTGAVDSMESHQGGSTKRMEQQTESDLSIEKEQSDKKVERPIISWITIVLILMAAGWLWLRWK